MNRIVVLLLILPLLLTYSLISYGQVRILQWSDTHSTLSTLPQQLAAIDHTAAEFYSKNPQGEFVVFVLGDFISLNPYSRIDNGQLSLDALKYLKEKGYTVLYTPGNHDAFDWSGTTDGIELFLEHLRVLHQLDIPILASNFKGARSPLKELLTSHYVLKSLAAPTAIAGLTIETLFQKSNVTKQNAKPIFKGIADYETTTLLLLKHLEAEGIKNLILGIHHGHKRLKRLVEFLNDKPRTLKKMKLPLVMGGDDHLVAAYRVHHTLISDAGSHGSMSVIDLPYEFKPSRIDFPKHIARTPEARNEVNTKNFEGDTLLTLEELQLSSAELTQYSDRLNLFLNAAQKTLNRILATTRGILEHKQDLKKGRSALGDLLAESLKSWAFSIPGVTTTPVPVFAFVNSSSYRIEEPLPPGPLTEYTVREMYPFLSEATVYRLSGEQIETLFFSLRKFYQHEDQDRYTPQLSLNLRENGSHLEAFNGTEWTQLSANASYILALDGWLSEHRFGQGSQIKQWLKILQNQKPIATKIFQEVLVDELPKTLTHLEAQHTLSVQLSCKALF